MSVKNSKKESICPFTTQPIQNAFGPEIALFLHCHLRGYDKAGDGVYKHNDYYDKYGAPVSRENSWEEGYHVIEKTLAAHYNAVLEKKLDLPLVAGVGGGVHIYKSRHNHEPWNWTGWVPRQRRWLTQGTFFSNRHFLMLRGNEVQNNLWDYDPHDEEEDEDVNDLLYTQLEPNDRYKGGYFFHCQPFGRYLHIMSLKSHVTDNETGKCKRYNYVVHPLAYRASIKTIPDNSVDAMQWCIINLPEEEHFGENQPWGEKCHGLEIFNDFTHFYSYQEIKDGGPKNGELCYDEKILYSCSYYFYWFDTYPLEFGVFLLDSALTRGVYYHIMCANDAFYQRKHGSDEGPNHILSSDPKGHLLKHNRDQDKCVDPRAIGVRELTEEEKKDMVVEEEEDDTKLEAALFLNDQPYGKRAAFGHVTLIDPKREITAAVFDEKEGIPHMGLDQGELLALDFLQEGHYYSSTGAHNLFHYDYWSVLPFRINKQEDPTRLCYEITENMELEFDFSPCTEKNADLVWRYKTMIETEDNKLETSHGYFKLDTRNKTKLDLTQTYNKMYVKWIYFTAISPENPSRRAWFNPIRGPAFGKPRLHAKIPPHKHNIVGTQRFDNTVTPKEIICPTAVALEEGGLDFTLEKAENKNDIYVYFMQVCPLQQDFSEDNKNIAPIQESSDIIPPRIEQSVHGYVPCSLNYPTRINLNNSWDHKTVKDQMVYFYRIDGKTGEPSPIANGKEPKVYGQQNFYEGNDLQNGQCG